MWTYQMFIDIDIKIMLAGEAVGDVQRMDTLVDRPALPNQGNGVRIVVVIDETAHGIDLREFK